jgi:translocator protein
MSKTTDFLILAGSLAACFLAGGIGSIFTTAAIPTWYAGLVKPAFTPPNVVFGPVWSTLYLLMGISLFLVWRMGSSVPAVSIALVFFWSQLLFNTLWSISFFGLRSPLLGFLNIALLWTLILITLVLFLRVNRPAGLLLIPYLLWVSYASVLNLAIWRLNP